MTAKGPCAHQPGPRDAAVPPPVPSGPLGPLAPMARRPGYDSFWQLVVRGAAWSELLYEASMIAGGHQKPDFAVIP